MALDFTSIKDSEGAAIFLIHDGSTVKQKQADRLYRELQKLTRLQIVIVSAREQNGVKIRDFYDLTNENIILIIRDNDEIHALWQDPDIPSAQQLAYSANQV